MVIHCAADIRLEEPIQTTLVTNYLGTKALLDEVATWPALRCFTHVSSAFANVNQPMGSVVQEKIYPLHFGDTVAHHEVRGASASCLAPACSPLLNIEVFRCVIC